MGISNCTGLYVMLISMPHEKYMKRALTLARRARGKTSPNPMVGAVLVKAGKVIAEAYHRKAGTPHAEALALEIAGKKANGSTLYVTLEPCCHSNKRTPPCASAIVTAGIKRVFVAMQDPNPLVSGKGVTLLEKAGIKVDSGLLEQEAMACNYAYIKHISTGMPFVTLKTAVTMDGKIATPEGQSKWITGPVARGLVHRMRSESDAIMTAIGTVVADDPRLTARTRGGRNPVRVIIDPDLKISMHSNVLHTPPETLLVTSSPKARKLSQLKARGIGILEFRGALDMGWLMTKLGAMGITSVLAEGGASFNWRCLDSGIVDRVAMFMAPRIIGGTDSLSCVGGKSFRPLEDAIELDNMKTRMVGNDLLITADVRHTG